VSASARRLRAYLLERAKRERRVLGRRPMWSTTHRAALVEQAKRARREGRR
jgi:hypothetical protein